MRIGQPSEAVVSEHVVFRIRSVQAPCPCRNVTRIIRRRCDEVGLVIVELHVEMTAVDLAEPALDIIGHRLGRPVAQCF